MGSTKAPQTDDRSTLSFVTVRKDRTCRKLLAKMSFTKFSAASNNPAETQNAPEHSQWDNLVVTFWVSRLFGVAPVTFQRTLIGCPVQVNNNLHVGSRLLVILLHAGLIIGTVLDWQYGKRGVRMREGWTLLSWFSEMIILISINTIGVFGAPARINATVTYLNAIDQIKSNIEFPQGQKTSRRFSYATVYLIISTILLFISDWSSYYRDSVIIDEDNIVMYFYSSFYVESSMLMMLELQFMWVAIFIHSGLKSINSALEGLIYFIDVQRSSALAADEDLLDVDTSQLPRPVKRVNTIVDTMTPQALYAAARHLNKSKYVPESLNSLANSYGVVCDAIAGMNDSYGLMLLLFVAWFIVHFTITPFNFLRYLYSKKPRTGLMLHIIFVIHHFLFMLVLVEPGYLTEKQNDHTQTLARQLLQRVTSPQDPMIAELDILLKHIKLNKVYYSPLKLCRLTRSLITVILGGATTYLVIILQFHHMNDIDW